MEAIIAMLIPAAGTIITTLVSWGLLELKKYIAGKTNNEAVNNAVAHISNTTETIVKELEQTVVPYYKENAVNGKLTKDHRDALKNMALFKVKSQVPVAVAKLAGMAVTSLDDLISGKIEKTIFEMK